MRFSSDSTHNLCLKDLSKEVIEEMACRLNSFSVKKQFYQAFGLKPKRIFSDVLKNISELFPDTPVRLLRDVCESLELYDLVELLEKAKPRTLRPALSLKEIGKLRSDSDRPTKFHSKAAILIIDNSTTTADDTAEKIESFFKRLNPRNEVTTITARPLVAISNVLRKLEETKGYFESGAAELKEKEIKKSLGELQRDLKVTKKLSQMEKEDDFLHMVLTSDIEKESALKKQLEEQIERRKRWKKERKPKIEMAMKLKENELQEEKRKLQLTVSPTMEKWIHSEGSLKLYCY